ALAAGQRRRKAPVELSSYHLATEMAAFAEGLAVAVPVEAWQPYVALTTSAFAAWLHGITKGMDYHRYRKNPPGPKNPAQVKRTRRGAHRSTARELRKHSASP